MADTRSLRDLFDDLTSRSRDADAASHGSAGGVDPAALLSGAGHGDLPPDLVAEALSSYAGTAPLPVAEHLSPFVSAWTSGGAEADATQGLDLLVGAATGAEPAMLDDPWAGDAAWHADGGSIDDLDSPDLDASSLDSPDLDAPSLDLPDLDLPDLDSPDLDEDTDLGTFGDRELAFDTDHRGAADESPQDEAAQSPAAQVVDFGAVDISGETDDVFGHGASLSADFGSGSDLSSDLGSDDTGDDGFDD